MTSQAVLTFAINGAILFLGLGIFISFIRLLIGPSLADRILAIELTSSFLASLIAVYSIKTDETVYLSVITLVILITFLGSVAFAHYLILRRMP